MNDLYINIIIIFIIVIIFFSITIFFNKKRGETFNEIENLINQLKEHETIIKTRKESKEKNGELTGIENNSKITVLIENMDYAQSIIQLAKNEYNVEVSKTPSREILSFLEEDNIAKKQTLIHELKESNIVSFPYWALNELIDDEKIIKPLNDLISKRRLEKWGEEYYTTINLVKKENKVYGLPFSKITALIAYNNKYFDNKPDSYEDIINKLKENNRFKFSLFCSIEARSYFYYFFIICGSYGVKPFKEVEKKIKHNLNDEKCDKALATLLELLKYSIKSEGSWNDPLKQLKDETTIASFIWSEQLSQIVTDEKTDLDYRGTPIYDKKNFYNIFEGWFLALINKSENDNSVVKKLDEFAEITKKPIIVGQTFNSPNEGSRYPILIAALASHQKYKRPIQLRIERAIPYVYELFEKSEPIPNTKNFGKVMYQFCKVFDENEKIIEHLGKDSLQEIKEHIIQKLENINITENEN